MKKNIFSGIQPSGSLTIGNYIGAVKSWQEFMNDYRSIFCVVDLHSLTVPQDPADLRQRTKSLLALYIAMGLDPQKCTLFVQSHVPAHSELTWLLNCFTYMGEASRMIQFKEKSAKSGENVGLGLLNYPVLMAADILLYDTHLVPIGQDQKQHLELTRDLAIRINNRFGEVFVVPEAFIPKSGAKIMSLSDPSRKMSKSDEDVSGSVYMLDGADVVMKKFKRAVTDSQNTIAFSEQKAGISNLLTIYCECAKKSMDAALKEFEGFGYGKLKVAVAEAVIALLEPIQARYAQLIADEGYLEQVMADGARQANQLAQPVLSRFKDRIGLINLG